MCHSYNEFMPAQDVRKVVLGSEILFVRSTLHPIFDL